MVAKGKRGFSAGHDRLAGLFQPDVFLPAQFFAAFRREGGLERERLLMLAVLEDAIDCYQKYAHSRDPRGRQMYEEAREWVTSTDRIWLFAFENNQNGQRPRMLVTPETAPADLRKATA